MKQSIEQRFWAKVDCLTNNDCWLWRGAKNNHGYGQLRVAGKIAYAHRLSWELSTGEVPTDAQIDHRCHNPSCVNPSHLRRATNKQNAENLLGARRHSRTGVLGVSRTRAVADRWQARVRHNGKDIHIGTFGSIAEAEAAVRAKRMELFTHNDADHRAAS